RSVAARHGCPLIDGPAEVRAASPNGILDDNMFHDAQHPALAGHIALARAVLRQLRARKALGWREAPVPVIDSDDCAKHFKIGLEQWGTVCKRAAWFYGVTAPGRFDRTERLAKQHRYQDAGERLDRGTTPEEVNVPGVGTHPKPVIDFDWA